MVRCGHCLKAFDTRPNFAPEEIDPQLELPLLDDPVAATGLPAVENSAPANVSEAVLLPFTLSEQADFTPDKPAETQSKRLTPLWTVATLLLMLLLLAQATYLFRVELSVRMPRLKPVLTSYCHLLKCSVPLPQRASLMSIESSEIKDDPAHRNQIILFAQLRNRAAYAQAFPNLELTLTDSQDKALARRNFRPEEYSSSSGQLASGLPANQELSIKLLLDTADLKPVGYRLMLYYPNNQTK